MVYGTVVAGFQGLITTVSRLRIADVLSTSNRALTSNGTSGSVGISISVPGSLRPQQRPSSPSAILKWARCWSTLWQRGFLRVLKAVIVSGTVLARVQRPPTMVASLQSRPALPLCLVIAPARTVLISRSWGALVLARALAAVIAVAVALVGVLARALGPALALALALSTSLAGGSSSALGLRGEDPKLSAPLPLLATNPSPSRRRG